jgi:hypothetical protein
VYIISHQTKQIALPDEPGVMTLQKYHQNFFRKILPYINILKTYNCILMFLGGLIEKSNEFLDL